MTDENAPVRKHLRNAKEHLRGVAERREQIQGLIDAWQAQHAQNGAHAPTSPTTEEASNDEA